MIDGTYRMITTPLSSWNSCTAVVSSTAAIPTRDPQSHEAQPWLVGRPEPPRVKASRLTSSRAGPTKTWPRCHAWMRTSQLAGHAVVRRREQRHGGEHDEVPCDERVGICRAGPDEETRNREDPLGSDKVGRSEHTGGLEYDRCEQTHPHPPDDDQPPLLEPRIRGYRERTADNVIGVQIQGPSTRENASESARMVMRLMTTEVRPAR